VSILSAVVHARLKNEITRSDVKEIVVLKHYAGLPYPDFLELARPKRGGNEYVIIEFDANVDMMNSSFENLAAYEFPSPYIKRPANTVIGWDEYATDDNFKNCVEIGLIQQCHTLIDQGLIEDPDMLSHNI